MDLTHIISFVGGALAAAVPILSYVASKTKTKVDDDIIAWVEKILPFLPAEAPKPPAQVVRPTVVDHRK